MNDLSRVIPYLASLFSQYQFKRMHIDLYISSNDFNPDLREKIDKVDEINNYKHIFPKSIQIYSTNEEISFFEKIKEFFDNSITLFSFSGTCSASASKCRFLSNNLKSIIIFLK
jgi:hypothetical protein